MQVLNFIQGMLSPAVMISACGLLLLGMNNKYSLVVNRIRLLNAERRDPQTTAQRRKCIDEQLPLLVRRMKLIKNAVWLYTISVALTVMTMIEIAVEELFDVHLFFVIISTFVVAVIFVLLGSLFAAQETRLGYKIVRQLEVRLESQIN